MTHGLVNATAGAAEGEAGQNEEKNEEKARHAGTCITEARNRMFPSSVLRNRSIEIAFRSASVNSQFRRKRVVIASREYAPAHAIRNRKGSFTSNPNTDDLPESNTEE